MGAGAGFAGIGRAGISVVTGEGRAALAGTLVAEIVDGAGISVVAGGLDVRIGTARIGQATVQGARISVVTRQRTLADAGTTCASVLGGAAVLVITGGRVGSVGAAPGLAAIVGAEVTVVAIEEGARRAGAACARVSKGACVTIRAWERVVGDKTALQRIAAIVGAGIFVVATLKRGGLALAVGTSVALGAGVAIVTFGLVGRVDATLIAACIVGACVAVVAGEARSGGAGALFAGVSKGAGIPVVAGQEIGRGLAAHLRVAAVVGAIVIVITRERLAHANSVLTMVRLGAGRSVQTLSARERLVGTSLGAQAGVLGAGVAVVAGALVDQAITIVVAPVANLQGRRRCVARGESLGFTDPHPVAGPEFVGVHTRARQTRGDGEAGAFAGAGGRDALVALAAVGALHLLAIVVLGAGGIQVAGAAAEALSTQVLHAGARRVPRAALGGLARQAKVGEVGGADVLAITATGHQGAGPSLGAGCVAGLGADLLAHMLGANARETVFGGLAGLAETTLAGLAV